MVKSNDNRVIEIVYKRNIEDVILFARLRGLEKCVEPNPHRCFAMSVWVLQVVRL